MVIDMATGGDDSPMGAARPLSSFCRANLEIQGNLGLTDAEMLTHRTGFRFAYQMCFAITLIGTVLQSIPVLAVAATAAFLAIFPPNHPFDNIYDATVGRMLNRPKLPPRTAQGRFACSLATLWLIGIIVLFAVEMSTAATAAAVVLLLSAGLVGFFDVCIPSMVYNLAVFKNLKPRQP
jgi:hypothetical protein